jgi:hypothetical protein
LTFLIIFETQLVIYLIPIIKCISMFMAQF